MIFFRNYLTSFPICAIICLSCCDSDILQILACFLKSRRNPEGGAMRNGKVKRIL